MPIDPGDLTGDTGDPSGLTIGALVETKIVVGGTTIAARTVTDDIASILSSNGFTPSSFEVLAWPTGATRHARIRLLLAKVDYDQLVAALPEWMTPVVLSIASVAFERMWVLEQKVVAYSEASGPVYAVDLVDGRFWWAEQPTPVTTGFNITTDDREVLYDASLDVDQPWTYEIAIAELFTFLAPFATGADFDGTTKARMMSSLGLKDLMVERLSVPQIIDRLLVLSGHVLVADRDGTYRILAIEQGDADLDVLMEAGAKDVIITAGPAAVATTTPTNAEVAGLLLAPEWLARYNAERVQVIFPTALEGGKGYRFDAASSSAGVDYVLGRWHRVVSTEGQPPGLLNNAETVTVFDPEWAVFDADGVIQNQTDLDTRADEVAAGYYGRLSSGAGRLLFSGLVDMLYGGASMIHFSVVRFGPDRGIYTEVFGEVNDSIYGHEYDRPISAIDILSIGPVRAIPRPGGGVLLDAVSRTSLVHLAHITGVDPDTDGFNANYKAQAIDDSTITVPKDLALFEDSVTFEAPITRPVVAPPVRLIPLSDTAGPSDLGDLCQIVIETDEADPPVTVHALFAWEKIDTTECPPGAMPPDPIGEAMVLSALGVI